MDYKFHRKPNNWKWQRFYRLKDESISLEEGLAEYHGQGKGVEWDEHWDFLIDPLADIRGYIAGVHCCEDCYYNHIGMATADDICEYNYQRLYEMVVNNHKTLQQLNLGGVLAPPVKTALEELEHSTVPGNHIEQRLGDHFRHLQDTGQTASEKVEAIRLAVEDLRNVEIIKNAVGPEHGEFVAKWATLLAPFWLRSPQTWQQDGRKSIIEHIFACYQVPEILLEQWFSDAEHTRPYVPFKWICWYIIIGQGGSLKKAAEVFGWKIANKFQHFLLKVPRTQYPMEACLYAEILRLGGTRQDFMRIMYSRILVLDPTEPLENNPYNSFWKQTVLWLIQNRELITDEESSLIIDWAVHRYTESIRDEYGAHFTFKGRTVNRVLEESLAYAEQLNLPSWIGHMWNSRNWDWSYTDGQNDFWQIIELTNGKELYDEGRAMQHCVGMYAGRCVSGSSAIFSLRKNSERKVTVEISPGSRILVQARGQKNRPTSSDEAVVIKRWMGELVK